MAGGGREAIVPGDLPVIVRVDVDEARRHREAFGVDLLAPGARDPADGRDPPVLHRHVCFARRAAGAVEHGAVAHHEVELGCHGSLPEETVAQGYIGLVNTSVQ